MAAEVPGPGVPGDLGPEPHAAGAAGGHRTRDATGAAGLGAAESVARQRQGEYFERDTNMIIYM